MSEDLIFCSCAGLTIICLLLVAKTVAAYVPVTTNPVVHRLIQGRHRSRMIALVTVLMHGGFILYLRFPNTSCVIGPLDTLGIVFFMPQTLVWGIVTGAWRQDDVSVVMHIIGVLTALPMSYLYAVLLMKWWFPRGSQVPTRSGS